MAQGEAAFHEDDDWTPVMTDFPDPSTLLERKIAGYTVDAFLDSDDQCQWYELHADDGSQAIL